ncbi:MAG: hypothetical protein R3228_01195 [Halioglobus sp.]|nr:hypothetical protein [Halioglobus sp.]
MFKPRFVIKGINQQGEEVQASQKCFSSVYRAELETLEFYGDARFKIVWVERQRYGAVPANTQSGAAAG